MNKQELIKEIIRSLNDVGLEDPLEEKKAVLQEILIKENLDIESALTSLKSYSKKYGLEKTDINNIRESSKKIFEFSDKLYDDIEMNDFFGKGKFIDTDKLKEIYKLKKLKKKFPKFNIDKFCEILENPIIELKNYAGEIIYYDKYVIRKFLIALIQMIFDEMDIYIGNVGEEGTGKSCWSSKVLFWFYTILSTVGLIEYAYDIKKLFFSSITSLQYEQNEQKNEDYFRIQVLDEGNDLNRGDSRKSENKTFKYGMRTSRKLLRIIIINMQQLGELDTSITLSRLNFIFDCKMENDIKTGTLHKGLVKMYILPRGRYIYSPLWKKKLSKIEIKNAFANKLERKKDYYVSLPEQVQVHQFNFNNVWGFNKSEYDEYIKNEIKKSTVGNEIKLTEYEVFLFDKYVPKMSKWATIDMKNQSDKTAYWTLNKLNKRIEQVFLLNPQLKSIYENILLSKSSKTEKMDKQDRDNIDKSELTEDTEIPNRFKEEVEYLPDLDPEKPKDFYFNVNK